MVIAMPSWYWDRNVPNVRAHSFLESRTRNPLSISLWPMKDRLGKDWCPSTVAQVSNAPRFLLSSPGSVAASDAILLTVLRLSLALLLPLLNDADVDVADDDFRSFVVFRHDNMRRRASSLDSVSYVIKLYLFIFLCLMFVVRKS